MFLPLVTLLTWSWWFLGRRVGFWVAKRRSEEHIRLLRHEIRVRDQASGTDGRAATAVAAAGAEPALAPG